MHDFMKIFIPALLTIMAFSSDLLAQVDDDWRIYKPKQDTLSRIFESKQTGGNGEGQIDIHMDSRIARIDSLKKLRPTHYDGYRVQIYFGERNEAQNARVEFLRKYPDMGAYVSYLAPNFRLRVGDFRTRIDSEKFKNAVTNEYPGSYIVKDHIELPTLTETEEKSR